MKKRIHRTHSRCLRFESLEDRRLLNADKIAVVLTHGQTTTCGESTMVGAVEIKRSMEREVQNWYSQFKHSLLVNNPNNVLDVHYTAWDTCGAVRGGDLDKVYDALERFASGTDTLDVILVGHSRGAIFTNRLMTDMSARRPNLASKLDRTLGIYLDATAARPFPLNDVYPSAKPALLDELIVYDDELAWDRDVPVALARGTAGAAGCATGAAIGRLFGKKAAKAGCEIGRKIANAPAEFATETLERWGVKIELGLTDDGRRVPGGEYRKVGQQIDRYIDSPAASQTFKDRKTVGLESFARHEAIPYWYAQSDDLKNDVIRFVRNRNPVFSSVSIENNLPTAQNYSLQWSNGVRQSFSLAPRETKIHWVEEYEAGAKVTYLKNGSTVLREFSGRMTSRVPLDVTDSRRLQFVTTSKGVDLIRAPLQADLEIQMRSSEINSFNVNADGLSLIEYDIVISNLGEITARNVFLELYAIQDMPDGYRSIRLLSENVPSIRAKSNRVVTGTLIIPTWFESGRYRINYRLKTDTDEIREENNRGSFGTLLLKNWAATSDEPNDSMSTSSFLTHGALANSRSSLIQDPSGRLVRTLHRAGDKDYYRIDLQSFAGAGSEVRVRTDDASSRVDLTLVNERNELVLDSVAVSNTERRLNLDYLRSGTYYALVSAKDSSRRHYYLEYTMTERGLPRDASDGFSVENEVPFSINPSSFQFSGTIFTPGDSDQFEFTTSDWASENSRIRLSFKEADGRVTLSLLDSTGRRVNLSPVVSILNDGRKQLEFDVSYLPPGVWSAFVIADWLPSDRSTWDHFFDVNYYDLNVSISPLGEHLDVFESNGLANQATPITRPLQYVLAPGWQQGGIPNRRTLPSISPSLETDYYSIELVGWGQPKNGVEVQPSRLPVEARLEDATGRVLVTRTIAADTKELLSLDDQPPGTYRLRVRGIQAGFSTYELIPNLVGIQADTFEPNASSENATQLGSGLGEQDHTIHRKTDEDWFRFRLENTGRTGNHVSLSVPGNSATFAGTGKLSLSIHDNQGRKIGDATQVDGVSEFRLTGVAAGTYFARVSGGGANTNRYRLSYDLVTASRLPFVIGNDGFPYTNVSNSIAVDDDPLIGDGIIFWVSTGSSPWLSNLYRFSTTIPNSRPEVLARDIELADAFHADGPRVVWSAFDGNDYEIFYFDGERILQLTDNFLDDRKPRVSGERVVWQAGPQFGASEIYMFDQDGVRAITQNSFFSNENPQVDGDLVVWNSPGTFGSLNDVIYAYRNGTTVFAGEGSLATTGCSGTGNGCRPEKQVSDGKFVYIVNTEPTLDNRQLWMWDGQPIMLFQFSSLAFPPVIGGNWVAWQSTDRNVSRANDQGWIGEAAPAYNIFLYDGENVRQLTDNQAGDFAEYPWVTYDLDRNSSRLIWHQSVATGDDPEIMVYESGIIRQLTDNEFREFHFREEGGRVVWANLDPSDIFFVEIAPQTIQAVLSQPEASEGNEVQWTLRRLHSGNASELVISIRADDALSNQLSFPSLVTIPKGVDSIQVPIKINDNRRIDGDREITLFATSPGFRFAESNLTIRDQEQLSLELPFVSRTVFEDAGDQAISLRIHRHDESSEQAVSVQLRSSDRSISVPPSATIPAGQMFVDVLLDVVNDGIRRSIGPVAIVAEATSFAASQTTIDVLETSKLSVRLQSTNPNSDVLIEGQNFELVIERSTLDASDRIELTIAGEGLASDLPTQVILEPGQVSKSIAGRILENDLSELRRELRVVVDGGGYAPNDAQVFVDDNDQPTLLVDWREATSLGKLRIASESVFGLNGEPSMPVRVTLTSNQMSFGSSQLTLDRSNWRDGATVLISGTVPLQSKEFEGQVQWETTSDDSRFHNLRGTLSFTSIQQTPLWQNSVNQFDVDNDNVISPLDVLVIINFLNSSRGSKPDFLPSPFLDVDGDDLVSPLDVLNVINKINSNQQSGEGEESLQRETSYSLDGYVTDSALSQLFWANEESDSSSTQLRRRLTQRSVRSALGQDPIAHRI